MTLLPMLLPECRWRGPEIEPGRYGCSSRKLVVGSRGVRGETCRTRCPFVDHAPPVGLEEFIAAQTPKGPCVHLGPPTGEFRDCPTCSGNVRLKVMGCGVHTTTTVGRKVDGVACCVGCPDFKAAGP